MSKVTTMYDGVEIEYDEHKDVWRFELYGKERHCQTLLKAKEMIDAPAPKEKKSFQPAQALLKDYRGVNEVTVTSEAESGREFWVKNKKGERSKESASYLFFLGPANTSLVKEALGYQTQASEFQAKAAKCYESMAPFPGLRQSND